MLVNKWDFKRREYTKVEIPKFYHSPLLAEMDEQVNCIHCGNLLPYGNCYTSRRYHSQHGFGYPVCSTCYEEEWKEEHNATFSE